MRPGIGRLTTPQLGGGDQAAQIFIAGAIRHQHVEPAVIVQGKFGADDRLEPGLDRGVIKARRAVEAVAVTQGEGRVAQFGCAIDQVLGLRSALQEAKGTARAQFNVGNGCHLDSSFIPSPFICKGEGRVRVSGNIKQRQALWRTMGFCMPDTSYLFADPPAPTPWSGREHQSEPRQATRYPTFNLQTVFSAERTETGSATMCSCGAISLRRAAIASGPPLRVRVTFHIPMRCHARGSRRRAKSCPECRKTWALLLYL